MRAEAILKSRAFSLVLDQSSPGVMSMLEGQVEYAAVHKNRELMLIQQISCKFVTNTKSY